MFRPERSLSSSPGPRLDGAALALGASRLPLYSGAMHYWRAEPSRWEATLTELRHLGLPLVETYVPWDIHERAAGEFDFGESDPRLDLGAFLDTAERVGLYVFLRPGPHINAELTRFGIPERVIYDRACQAWSPRQNPVILGFPPQMFPVPSYVSHAFHEEVMRWFAALAPHVVPRLYPRGPVVLLQVDNEASFYFRNGPFDQDYHPDALVAWAEFLEEKYGDLSRLNEAHRRAYPSFREAFPPQRFLGQRAEDLVLYLDWAEFQERVITHSIARFREGMESLGMRGVPFVHNVPLGEGGLPLNLPALNEVVDIVGLDYYHAAREYPTIKRRSLYLSGSVELPYAPEMGVGAPPWFTPLSTQDSLFCALCALAFGVRGFNLYMAVDRDRWYGAPIDGRGTPRIEAGLWKHLLLALQRVGFADLKRRTPIALLIPREYARLSRVTHLLGPISPSTLEAMGGTPVDASREDSFGFEAPIQVLWWHHLATIAEALDRAGLPYAYVDSEAPLERLRRFSVVFAPTYEFVARARQQKLKELERLGVRVVYGPTQPTLDEEMKPHPFASLDEDSRQAFASAEEADRLIASLRSEFDLHCPFPTSPSVVESVVHEDAHGPRLLFVINPSGQAQRAKVTLPEAMLLDDLLHPEEIRATREAEIDLAPLSCRVFRLERDPLARHLHSQPPSPHSEPHRD